MTPVSQRAASIGRLAPRSSDRLPGAIVIVEHGAVEWVGPLLSVAVMFDVLGFKMTAGRPARTLRSASIRWRRASRGGPGAEDLSLGRWAGTVGALRWMRRCTSIIVQGHAAP